MGKIGKSFRQNKGHQLALSPDEIEANGEGIFGKAFDSALKKVGIKKAVYKAGDKVKPIVKEVIDKGAKAAATYVPALRPAISPLANLTKDYLDRPEYYQKNKGRNAGRELKRIGIKAGTQIARDQAMDYFLPSQGEGEGLYAGYGLYASRVYGQGATNMGHNLLSPALQSQPYGENFLWRRTLPVEYAKLHY
jgi:hypothetical protein